jgi:thiaminase
MTHPPGFAPGERPGRAPRPPVPSPEPASSATAGPAIGSLSNSLLEATRPQQADLLSHDWTTQAFAGENGNTGAITTWAQQDQHFCRFEDEALHKLLGYGPPALLRNVLVDLILDCGREPEMFAEILDEIGAGPARTPSLVCEGYGCWLYWQAGQGLLEGAVAILAAEAAYCQMFDVIDRSCPPGSPWRPRVENWASPRFRDLVRDLQAGVDELTGGKTAPGLAGQLTPVAVRGLQREKAFLDMCWFGHGEWTGRWPG